MVRDRDEKQLVFRTTQDLKECIERIARKWKRDDSSSSKNKSKGGKKNAATSRKQQQLATKKKASTHPATRCFQALRIYVNEELQHVEVRCCDHVLVGLGIVGN